MAAVRIYIFVVGVVYIGLGRVDVVVVGFIFVLHRLRKLFCFIVRIIVRIIF